MKKIPVALSAMLCVITLFCSCGGSSLSGTYKSSGEGDVNQVSFSGSNKIVLELDSYMDIAMSGTYTIEDGKLSAAVSYSLEGETDKETFTYDFTQNGNEITLGNQVLTK